MYPWVVFLHVLAAFGFMMAHGASASVSFRLRRERNIERIRALLDLSVEYMGVMYGTLGLLLLAGIVAGFMGRWWRQGWIWWGLGLLIVLMLVMFVLGTSYYSRVRKAVGLEFMERMKPHPPIEPASAEEIDALLTSSRPMLLTVIGFGGLAVIVWLMMFKPF